MHVLTLYEICHIMGYSSFMKSQNLVKLYLPLSSARGINSDLFVIRLLETLKLTDPNLIQVDDFKNEQLLCLTANLLLFIRSQVPVTKKLFQSCEFTQNKSEMPDKCSKLFQGLQLLSVRTFQLCQVIVSTMTLCGQLDNCCIFLPASH